MDGYECSVWRTCDFYSYSGKESRCAFALILGEQSKPSSTRLSGEGTLIGNEIDIDLKTYRRVEEDHGLQVQEVVQQKNSTIRWSIKQESVGGTEVASASIVEMGQSCWR